MFGLGNDIETNFARLCQVLEGDTLYSLGARVGILDLEKQHPEIDPLCLKIDSTIDVEY